MSGATSIQTAFTAGELSPRMLGRSDLAAYFAGAKRMVNMIPHRHGGATKRPGTRFVAEVKDSDDRVRLERFAYNDTQQYVLEFGPLYVRFFRYDGNGNPVQLSNSGTPTEKVTTYTADQIRDLKFCQSADTLIITHPEHPPQSLTRNASADTDPANWTLANLSFVDGPYLPINTTPITLQPSGTTGTITVTASAPLFSGTSADVGRWIRLLHSTTWGACQITGHISTTQCTCRVNSSFAFLATTATANWRLGAWHGAEPGNWPSVAMFYQSRLFFAATANYPQTVWASRTGDFYTFSPTPRQGSVAADYAITATVDDDRVNKVEWIVGDSKGILILTSGGTFLMRGINDDTLDATESPSTRRQNAHSAHYRARPRQVGASLLCWQPSRTLRELLYSFENDKVDGADLTIRAEHIAVAGVEQAQWQELPDSNFWTAALDGELLCLTIERQEKVVAWSRHRLGGDGLVESIEIIRNPDTGLDEVWLSVLRVIDSATRRYVEVLQRQMDESIEHENSWFVDCGLKYDGAATDTISGLDHLEGETVSILADGATHPPRTVVGGEIELEYEASVVIAGLPIVSTLETMPITPQQIAYEARGVPRRIARALLILWRSLGGRCGVSEDESRSTPIAYRSASMAMDVAPDLFTGSKQMAVDGSRSDYMQETNLHLVHDDPQPFTILGLVLEAHVGDGP